MWSLIHARNSAITFLGKIMTTYKYDTEKIVKGKIDCSEIAGSFASTITFAVVLIDEKGNEHVFKIGNPINLNVWVQAEDTLKLTLHDNATVQIKIT